MASPEDDDTYRTVAGSGQAELTVRGSHFIGFVRPARTTAAAEAVVDQVTAEYDDATHVVPAYRVRADEASPGGHLLREYESDDGEPSGSAGKPALNVLQGQELENVVAVIVRYYGGTNLGIGGLVRAYSTTTTRAIEDADVVERRPQTRLRIGVDYDDSGTIRGILESEDCEFEATYEESVGFEVWVARAATDDLTDRLRGATSDRVDIEVVERED